MTLAESHRDSLPGSLVQDMEPRSVTRVPGEPVSFSEFRKSESWRESLSFLPDQADNSRRPEATFRHKPAPGQPVCQDSAEMEARKVRFPKPGHINSISFSGECLRAPRHCLIKQMNIKGAAWKIAEGCN